MITGDYINKQDLERGRAAHDGSDQVFEPHSTFSLALENESVGGEQISYDKDFLAAAGRLLKFSWYVLSIGKLLASPADPNPNVQRTNPFLGKSWQLGGDLGASRR